MTRPLDRLFVAVEFLTEEADGWPPTQRQIANFLGFGSVGYVNRLAERAVEEGLLERGPRGQLRVRARDAA